MESLFARAAGKHSDGKSDVKTVDLEAERISEEIRREYERLLRELDKLPQPTEGIGEKEKT